MAVKVNDIVRYLNDVGGGRVTRVEGATIYVEDEDGFERPTLAREVVVVGQSSPNPAPQPSTSQPARASAVSQASAPASTSQPQAASEPIIETEEGEQLNIVLAYSPRDIKRLSSTSFIATLVNDSNYYLQCVYMTRGDNDSGWTTRFAGLIEPNFQLDIDDFALDSLNSMTHIAVQYLAFKQGKQFKLKNPALVNVKIDVTKFYKLHCFKESEYFDEPVIELRIARNDIPEREMIIDGDALERAMREKKAAERELNRRRPVQKHEKKKGDELVVDLHINALLDNLNGLNNADMLRYQLDKFHEVMNANLDHPGQSIIFIHGKGNGVLRHAILQALRNNYPHCQAHDASFREYGFGATQVTIHR